MKKICKTLIVLFATLFVISSLASAQYHLTLNQSLGSATLAASPGGSGTGSPTFTIAAGTKVTISVAQLYPGTVFVNWTDQNSNVVSTNISFQITMPTSDVVYIAQLGYALTTVALLLVEGVFQEPETML